MSQSSSSSCRSPDSRRWKSSRDSPQGVSLRPKSWNMRQRKKPMYSLKQTYVAQWFDSSTESLTKSDDEDVKVSTDISNSTIQLSETKKNLPDYASLASRFGINLLTAQKHYSTLTSNPRVPIIRTVSIKTEIETPTKPIQYYERSPVLGSKKKIRKPKFKVEPKLSSENKGPVRINKRVNKNIEQYFGTLEAAKIKEEIVSPNDSQSEDIFDINSSQFKQIQSQTSQSKPKYKRWEDLIDSSADEFEFSNSQSCVNRLAKKSPAVGSPLVEKITTTVTSSLAQKNASLLMNPLAEKSTAMVTNPFSKFKCKPSKSGLSLKNSIKKKDSFWKEKFGSDDPVERKKKFIETFEIKKEVSEELDDDVNSEMEYLHKTKNTIKNELFPDENKIKIEKDDLKIKHKHGVKLENKKKRKDKHLKNRSSLSASTGVGFSINSLSVNCQQNFNTTKIKIENTNSAPNSQSNIPLSFGSGISDNASDNETDSNIKNNISDSLTTIKPSNEIEHKQEKATEPLNKDDPNTLNESCMSLDLCDSPTKLDIKLPLKNDLIKSSTPEPSKETIKEVNKSKAKPIIISDDKLPNNAIVWSMLKKDLKHHHKSIKSPDISPNKVENSCNNPELPAAQSIDVCEKTVKIANEAPSHQPEFNGFTKNIVDLQDNQQTIDSSKIVRTVKTFPKLDLDSHESQTEIILTDSNNIEEDFDSLCQDVVKRSNLDSITLYRSDQSEEPDIGKIILKVPPRDTNNTEQSFKVSNVLHKTEVTHSPVESSSSKSPVISQPSRRLRLNLKSPTSVQNNVSSPSILNRLQRQQQLHQQRNSENQISSLNNTNPLGSPIISKDSRLNRSLSPIKSLGLSERDPRLNRSISPVKSLGLSERDPRLNKSYSPLTSSTTVTDPRLLRGKSQPRQLEVAPQTSEETSNIIDPRLRKRKEREEAEKAAKLAELDKDEKNIDNSAFFSVPQDAPGPKRRKVSVFQRLGSKSNTPSPDRKVKEEPNELYHIVKSKTAMFDSDDDNVSLHPGELFSDEEELEASPPHRKFISERSRIEGSKTENVGQHLNQSTSVRNRLGGNWNAIGVNRRLAPSIPTSTATVTATVPTKPISVKDRLRLNANIAAQRRALQGIQSVTQTTVPKLEVGSLNTSFNEYGNSESFNENFYKMNAAQMLKDVDNLKTQELDNESYVTFDSDVLEKSTKFDHVSMLDGPNEPVQIGTSEIKTTFFRSYCFRTLRKGKCQFELSNCTYSHNVVFLYKLIKPKKVDLLYPILDFAIQNYFVYFLESIWKTILPTLQNEAFSVFEKLYQSNIRTEKILKEFLEFWLAEIKFESVEAFLKRVSPVVEKGDSETVRIICGMIKGKLQDGFCWEAIKDLSQKAVPPRDMIELTLIQCLKRKKNQSHINEVYDLVKNRLTVAERSKMSQPMLKQFFDLVQSKDISFSNKVPNTLPLTNATNKINTVPSRRESRGNSSDSLKSVENEKPSKSVVQLTTASLKNRRRSSQQESNSDAASTLSVQQPNNSPLEVRITTPNIGESTNFKEYAVSVVEADEPKSSFRDRFWKLYVAVHQIQEGLDHVDYEYVWKVLDEFTREDIQDELLKRAYYHILCKNVRNCERHVTEIIKQAVRCGWSVSRKSFDMLFETGVCALIDLADNDLWVMALQLLNWVKILEPKEPRTTFVLISAEIYLANNDPLEAVYLLQRTRLIRTNRDEWRTKDSTKDNEKHRNKLVFILLQDLTFEDPDKAVHLFKTLMEDQYIFHFPIDLPLYLDKFTLLLLLQNKEELAADICRIVMDNDLTFQRATYQELLSRLLPVDEVLANQILDYAIHLGYINDIQIKHGFTTVIIDMNGSEEEIYLMLKRLIHKLVLSIGPVIPHLKPNQLKVILIFEDIPAEKRLYRNEIAVIRKDEYKNIRSLVNLMLATRFTPPIRISRGKATKFCKIMSRSLVDYLKHWN